MKRFLSLVLSALFVFQLGNANCDAVSRWDERKVICADVYGKSLQPQGLIAPYIPQQQPIINVTAPEQPAPVVNVTPTPQNITVQSPAVNIKKVDATTWGDKVAGWLKCAWWLLLAGAVVVVVSGLTFLPLNKFDDWVEKKIRSLIVYLAGGEEQLEKKSKSFVLNVLRDVAKEDKKKEKSCPFYNPICWFS